MWALYKLQAKAYFSNGSAKTSFITTILFLLVLGSLIAAANPYDSTDIFGNMKLSMTNIAIISSITLMMIMNSALYSFGFAFYEMKTSVLLKRIGATKISKVEAISSFLLWGMTTMLFTVLWIALWVGIFQIPAVADGTGHILWVNSTTWENVKWGGVLFSMITTALAFYAIAFLFVSISKNSEMYNISTTFYYFFIAFLGGAFTPNAGRDWMTFISYLSPLGWGTGMMTDSIIGINAFQFGGYTFGMGPGMIDKSAFEATGQIVFPIIYGVLAAVASAKLFKWD